MPGRLCTSCGHVVPDESLSCPSCGEFTRGVVADDPALELAGRLQESLGSQYQVQERIGRGGYAVVFKVHDRRLERDLAAKVLLPELAATREVAERFRREARTAAKLNHPNIVPIFFIPEEGELACYVMPLIAGESLGARLRREGQLALRVALGIARDVASALDAAHRAGVVHRDVKPDNVLLEFTSGRGLLMDFGIAKALQQDAPITASGVVIGTPHYMSPEQAGGLREIDARADVYSLGAVVFEMLAGSPPFGGPSTQAVLAGHLGRPAPNVAERRGDVTADMAESIARALAKEPEDRFASAGAFVEALETRLAEPALRRSGGAVVQQQGADDVRLFRTLTPDTADPVPALKDADDVAAITEAAHAAVTRAVEAAVERDAVTVVRIIASLAARVDDSGPALRQPVRDALAKLARHDGVIDALAVTWRAAQPADQGALEKALSALMPAAGDVIVHVARREKSAELILLADRVGALDDGRGEALAGDASVAVVQALLRALRESLRPSALVERWLTVVARHARPEVRRMAAETAAARGGMLAARLGRLLAADTDMTVRAAGLHALGASRQHDVLPELKRALERGSQAEQVAAAEALGALGVPASVPLLAAVFERKKLLRLERGPVQHAAARALAALGDPHAREVLAELAKDKDPVVAQTARQSLGP